MNPTSKYCRSRNGVIYTLNADGLYKATVVYSGTSFIQTSINWMLHLPNLLGQSEISSIFVAT